MNIKKTLALCLLMTAPMISAKQEEKKTFSYKKAIDKTLDATAFAAITGWLGLISAKSLWDSTANELHRSQRAGKVVFGTTTAAMTYYSLLETKKKLVATATYWAQLKKVNKKK